MEERGLKTLLKLCLKHLKQKPKKEFQGGLCRLFYELWDQKVITAEEKKS